MKEFENFAPIKHLNYKYFLKEIIVNPFIKGYDNSNIEYNQNNNIPIYFFSYNIRVSKGEILTIYKKSQGNARGHNAHEECINDIELEYPEISKSPLFNKILMNKEDYRSWWLPFEAILKIEKVAPEQYDLFT